MIAVVVNGEDRRLEVGTTLDDLVEALAGEHRGVAAALNGEVVARADWPRTAVGDGDRVEILRAAQGG